MATTATAPNCEPSALTSFIQSHTQHSSHSSHYTNLALQVQHDLKYQHEWSSLTVHTNSPLPDSSTNRLLPRPLISGLAPRHVYIHPDEQVEMLKQGIEEKNVPVEREWVLPTHVREKWSLRKFAEVFDAIGEVPSSEHAAGERNGGEERASWKRISREKRVLMAVVNDDSTIVYYIVHDGIVKPRQN